MTEKKAGIIASPDVTKLKEVIIDHKTKIYIPHDADIEEAKKRYLSRNSDRRVKR